MVDVLQAQKANPCSLALVQLCTRGYFCQRTHSPPRSYQAGVVCYENESRGADIDRISAAFKCHRAVMWCSVWEYIYKLWPSNGFLCNLAMSRSGPAFYERKQASEQTEFLLFFYGPLALIMKTCGNEDVLLKVPTGN